MILFFRYFFFSYLYFFAIFVSHRCIVFPKLAGELEITVPNILSSCLIGIASDLWIAFLFSLTISLLSQLLAFLGNGSEKFPRVFIIGCLIISTISLGFHINYVAFFHHQFIPAHLPYLVDFDFIRANGSSGFNVYTASFIAIALLWAGTIKKTLFNIQKNQQFTPTLGLVVVLSFFLSLGSHSFNLIYRWRWFVPDKLRANVIESFFVDLVNPISLMKPLSSEELSSLSKFLGARFFHNTDLIPQGILRSATDISSFSLVPVGENIKVSFWEKVQTQQRPFIVVLLLESQRFYDIGALAGKNSLTPNLDALATRGISFVNAYSTAKITRAAQESSLCSHIGGEYFSLMRGTTSNSGELDTRCLPQLIGSVKGSSFWYHGGEPRFDSQVKFWQNQEIHNFLTRDDFPENTAQTGWGISDRAFYREATQKLQALSVGSRTKEEFFLGIMLSISNHIPWTLPPDGENSFYNATSTYFADPSYATASYADLALGELISLMKEKELWQKTLLIVTGDHGHLAKPYRSDLISPDRPHYEEELLSHVPLIVSGGIGESAANEEQIHTIEHRVSHASIYSFLAYLLNLQTTVKADPLFSKGTERLPVYSDLERRLYCPGENAAIFFRNIKLEDQQRECLLLHRYFNATPVRK